MLLMYYIMYTELNKGCSARTLLRIAFSMIKKLILHSEAPYKIPPLYSWSKLKCRNIENSHIKSRPVRPEEVSGVLCNLRYGIMKFEYFLDFLS